MHFNAIQSRHGSCIQQLHNAAGNTTYTSVARRLAAFKIVPVYLRMLTNQSSICWMPGRALKGVTRVQFEKDLGERNTEEGIGTDRASPRKIQTVEGEVGPWRVAGGNN